MNNSRIAIESVPLHLEELNIVDNLQERETELTRIIEAINRIKGREEWSTLKELLFANRIDSLEKQIYSEALNLVLNDSQLYRLQGRLQEAKQYDLDHLLEVSKSELIKIKKIRQN